MHLAHSSSTALQFECQPLLFDCRYVLDTTHPENPLANDPQSLKGGPHACLKALKLLQQQLYQGGIVAVEPKQGPVCLLISLVLSPSLPSVMSTLGRCVQGPACCP